MSYIVTATDICWSCWCKLLASTASCCCELPQLLFITIPKVNIRGVKLVLAFAIFQRLLTFIAAGTISYSCYLLLLLIPVAIISYIRNNVLKHVPSISDEKNTCIYLISCRGACCNLRLLQDNFFSHRISHISGGAYFIILLIKNFQKLSVATVYLFNYALVQSVSQCAQ